jgi:hypothetical protein
MKHNRYYKSGNSKILGISIIGPTPVTGINFSRLKFKHAEYWLGLGKN